MLQVQLLIFFFHLILSTADIQNNALDNSDAVVTMNLEENSCVMSNGNFTNISSSSPHYTVVEKMNTAKIQRPQCFIKEFDTKESKVTCYCRNHFSADCLDVVSLGESVYQWRRDRSSKVTGSTSNSISKSVEKVDCALKAFHKARKRSNRTAKIKFQLNLSACTQFKEFPTAVVPSGPDTIFITHTCNSQLVFLHVHCSDEHCFQKHRPFSFFLGIRAQMEEFVNKKKLNELFKNNLCNNTDEVAQCALTMLQDRTEKLALYHVSLKNKTVQPLGLLTIEQIGNRRLAFNVEDHAADASSNGHIFSWVIMGVYTLPFLFVCLSAVFSCSDVYRCELVHHTGPYLKDIETMIAEKQRLNGAKVASVHKEPKPKSAIVHMAVTTTSQMGNITDLGSEGPGVTGSSIKTAKMVKSTEETKEELAL